MTFPVYLTVGQTALHPHVVFDALAYVTGLGLLIRQRRRTGDTVDARTRWMLSVAAFIGGVTGSHLLFVVEDVATFRAVMADPILALQGKTIVGGLLGGLVAVELVKRLRHITPSTGDLLVLPVAAGLAVGRIGCFLTGLDDGTSGIPTKLPWGVDFGDGVARHPTQLYEIAFVVLLLLIVMRAMPSSAPAGDKFKLFLLGYLSFRLMIDFIKPGARFGGMSTLQWTCLAVIAYYAPHLPRLLAEARRV